MDNKVTILRKLKRFRFIFLGIFFGTLYWVVETCVHVYLLNEGTFIEQLLFPEFHDIWTRSLMGVVIITLCVIVQFLANKHEEANRALEKSEERFRSLFEYIVDPVFLADPQTRQIVDCNNQAIKMMEYSKENLFSMRADELHPEDVREKTMEGFRKQAKDELRVVDTEVITKSGKRIPVSINTSVVEISGKPHMVGIFRDITERKNMENKLKKHVSELERFNKLTVGRELNMIELKQEVNEVLLSTGQPEKYKIPTTEQINVIEEES